MDQLRGQRVEEGLTRFAGALAALPAVSDHFHQVRMRPFVTGKRTTWLDVTVAALCAGFLRAWAF